MILDTNKDTTVYYALCVEHRQVSKHSRAHTRSRLLAASYQRIQRYIQSDISHLEHTMQISSIPVGYGENKAMFHRELLQGRSLLGFVTFHQLPLPVPRPDKNSCYVFCPSMGKYRDEISLVLAGPAVRTLFSLESWGLLNDLPRSTLHTVPVVSNRVDGVVGFGKYVVTISDIKQFTFYSGNIAPVPGCLPSMNVFTVDYQVGRESYCRCRLGCDVVLRSILYLYNTIFIFSIYCYLCQLCWEGIVCDKTADRY